MSWINRLGGLMRPRRLDAELDDELRFHIESRVRQYVAEGMTPDAARRRARLAFGSRDRVKEECREADVIHWLDTAWRDLRYALRTLRASPLFTATAVLVPGARHRSQHRGLHSVIRIALETAPSTGAAADRALDARQRRHTGCRTELLVQALWPDRRLGPTLW